MMNLNSWEIEYKEVYFYFISTNNNLIMSIIKKLKSGVLLLNSKI